jgi:gliding motility-associated-like protein
MMLLLVFVKDSFAQTIYKMGNMKVVACKGKLKDSEANLQSTTKYANNEDYIFTVCVKGSSSIQVKFNGNFCTEAVSDYLKVYKGRDTSGTLIRTYSGSINNPISINANDTCLTFYFHSDANIVCDGWDLDWEAKITSVPQPVFTPISDPTCNSNKIHVILDQKFNCDSVKAGNFKLSGALSTAVISAVGVNCDGKNETNTFDITFASGLNKSGNYRLDFNSSFKDACDSVWQISARLNFKISDCPINVDLKSNKYTLCRGSCTNLTTIVTGGNASNYTYNWLSGGLSGAPPKQVCPSQNTQYILQVSDGVSVPGVDTIDIVVLDPPVAQNDTIVCQSASAFNLLASPVGGVWSGNGITNTSSGLFNPSVSGSGFHTIYYNIGSCFDSVIVNVRAINAGPPNAACPNSTPFKVSNFSPAGGKWTGPYIDSAGTVTPPGISGSFLVQYSWNGCVANKTINIDGIQIPQLDTICQSVLYDTFQFYPLGGIWSGAALSNSRLGINQPKLAGSGNKTYIYQINGCRDTLQRYIVPIDARGDEIACPDAGQRTLPAGIPVDGLWSGKGIVDPINGIFDADSFQVPSKITYAYSILTYTSPNGCKDDKIMYLRYTRFAIDTIKNCVSDTVYFMRNLYLKNDPWNMSFSGSQGIVGSSIYYQKFNPQLAGRGTYNNVVGSANGCADSIVIQVLPRANIQKDTSMCIADNPFFLKNNENGGVFSGKGITNGNTGRFSPAVAGKGIHLIYFNKPGLCEDTIRITVNALPVANMTGLKSNYCMRDTLIYLNLSPKPGVLSGPGTLDSVFNPYLAGTGIHSIQYIVGTGNCVSTVKKDIEVADTLQMNLFADQDTICPGTPVNLNTSIKGGVNAYDIRWNTGAYNVQSYYDIPKSSHNYRVVLKDGCSDSVVKSHFVFVHPKMSGLINVSPIQCYGNKGTASIQMNGVGPYTYFWNTIPVQNAASITAPVGTIYKVRVKDSKTGCIYDTMANIPGYIKIRAYFAVSPSGQCIFSNNAKIQIIDLSEGGLNGTWDYGDAQTEMYQPGTNPSHSYFGDTDQYKIRLIIRNEGNCMDSFSLNVCVLDTVTLFIPTAFTPNDDDVNEVFRIQTGSVEKAYLEIYNRWGEKLYETENINKGWDGKYQGNLCPADYYVYVLKYKGKKTPWKFQRGYFYIIR